MAVQMLSQYRCTPLLLIFLTEVNCLSLNLFLTSSHFGWGYRALWAHTYSVWVTEGRRHPNPSRLYPIHKLNADLILWSYVIQIGMVIMLSVFSGRPRFCSFLTLLHTAVSGSCHDLPFHCIPTDKPSTASESPSPAPVQIFCISILIPYS